MSLPETSGEIITFYSYKGGTGRSMALSNISCLLARQQQSGKGVLMVDWDLEAPGLHRYFHDKFQNKFGMVAESGAEFDKYPGLIDLFSALDVATKTFNFATDEDADQKARQVLDDIHINDYIIETDIPHLSLLKAGSFDEHYSTRVNTFNWEGLYERSPLLLRFFVERLAAGYKYVLIDSRTGLTDISGICTMLVPEKLVVVFTPNRQSLTGVLDLIQQATRYRRESDDLRPLLIYPVPSRIEITREALRSNWRFGSRVRGIVGYQQLFEKHLKDVYELSECDLNEYFNEVQIQQSPDYAYGEEIAVEIERTEDRFSLTRSYKTITEWLAKSSPPWKSQVLDQPKAMRPLCFVLMPFGKKPNAAGTLVDFDAIYAELIVPAIEEAGLEALRADEEIIGETVDKSMLERLIVCQYAVADLTATSPSTYYHLGLRHAARPSITILTIAEGLGVPLGIPRSGVMRYELNAEGRLQDAAAAIRAMVARLVEAQKAVANDANSVVDSPIYQAIEGYPDIEHTKTEPFREKVKYSAELKKRLAQARRKGINALRTLEKELGPIPDIESGVVMDLFLSYRSVKAWEDMVTLVNKMSRPLAQTVMVQEQLALSLNRVGRGEEAEKILIKLLESRGPSSETYGILGRIYKDRWESATKRGERILARGLLEKAIETYLRGFEADSRDAYPGINAVTLMEIREPPDPRRDQIIPVVSYAVERRIATGKPDYWDYATRLELAVLKRDKVNAIETFKDTVLTIRESWEAETTARNIRLIREALERRQEDTLWIKEIEDGLSRIANPATEPEEKA